MNRKRFGHKVLSVLACSTLAVLLMAAPAIAVREEERGRDRTAAEERGGGHGNPGDDNAARGNRGRGENNAASGQPPGGGNPGGGNPGGGNPPGDPGGGNPPDGGNPGGGNPPGGGGGNPGGGNPGGGNPGGGNPGGGNPGGGNPGGGNPGGGNPGGGNPGGGNPGGGNPGGGNAGGRPKVTLCHATGSARNPYGIISVAEPALPAHLAHGDIYPVPATGCPGADGGTNNVTVCHFTGVAADPYVERVIAVATLNAHLLHGDIYPVPIGGCPDVDVDVVTGTVTVCHFTGVAAAPYVEQVIPIAELGNHLLHGDIYPVPVDGCPDAPVDGGAGNVTVCHFTGVAGAPYVEQVIPIAALGSHLLHGDIYPVPVGGCPGAEVDEDGNVTVCHFIGVTGAPYMELVIPIAELSGHLLHGDLYPVPVGGCRSVAGERDFADPADGPHDADEDDPVAPVGQPQQPGINASVEPGAKVAVTGASVLGFLLFALGLIGSGVASLWRSKHQR